MWKIYRKQLATLLLILLALPFGVYMVLNPQSQDIRDRAAEQTQSPPQDGYLWNTLDAPEYVEGEVLVKLKQPLSFNVSDIEKGTVDINQQTASELPPALQVLNRKHPLKNIDKVFKGVKEPQRQLQTFQSRFSEELSSVKRIMNEEAMRKVDLSRTYKLTFDESTFVATVVKELSQNPDVEYAEPNYVYMIDRIPNDKQEEQMMLILMLQRHGI